MGRPRKEKPKKESRVRCKVRSRSTGEQCKRMAREGYTVCRSHGAGSVSRIKAGTAKDPKEAGIRAALEHRLTTGRYSRVLVKSHPLVAARIEEARLDLEKRGANLDREIAVLQIVAEKAIELGTLDSDVSREEIRECMAAVASAMSRKALMEQGLKLDLSGTVMPLLEDLGTLMRRGIEKFVSDPGAREGLIAFVQAGLGEVVRSRVSARLLVLGSDEGEPAAEDGPIPG